MCHLMRIVCLLPAQLCQRRAICTSWSPTPTAGWSATWWCGGRTSTSTTRRGTLWSAPSSTSPPPRWSTARTSRQCSRYRIDWLMGETQWISTLPVFCWGRTDLELSVFVYRPPTRSLCAQSIVGYSFKPAMTKRCMTGCMLLTLSLLAQSGIPTEKHTLIKHVFISYNQIRLY